MNLVWRVMEATVEFVWWWWGLHSHFHVQPNYSVEVVLRCVVLLTITLQCYSIACFFYGAPFLWGKKLLLYWDDAVGNISQQKDTQIS